MDKSGRYPIRSGTKCKYRRSTDAGRTGAWRTATKAGRKELYHG